MEIIKLNINEVIPYSSNPRKNDNAVDAVAESIKQCGYCSPIVIDEYNVILAGHTRLKALKKLKWKEVPAKVYDENASVIEEKPKAITFWIDTNTQLGSDEVGTGDFFGPISVVATLLTKQDIQEIKELGIDDSKKMTDKAIKELVPSLLI